MGLRSLQTLPNQFHHVLWRFDAFVGLLLKAVQHVNHPGDLDRLNRTVRITHVVLRDLLHTSPAKPLHQPGLIVFLSRLREVQREAKDINDVVWHSE